LERNEQRSVFNFVPGQAIQSMIECSLKQLRGHVNVFGFLNNYKNVHKIHIRKHAEELEAALTIIANRVLMEA